MKSAQFLLAASLAVAAAAVNAAGEQGLRYRGNPRTSLLKKLPANLPTNTAALLPIDRITNAHRPVRQAATA